MAAKKKESLAGGLITVGMGIRVSANYNSENFDISVTLPLRDGATPEEQLIDLKQRVGAFFEENVHSALNDLDQVIRSRKRGGS